MSSENEVMKLVAEVVDKASGPLKSIQDRLKNMGHASEKEHTRASKAAREHQEQIKELHERMDKLGDLMSGALSPAFSAVGLAGFGLGEMFDALGDKISEAGEKYQGLHDTIKRGHVSAQFVQGMSDAFVRLGMDASKANTFVAETGETLDKLRRGNAHERQRLTDQFSNTLPWLERVLNGAKNYADASERIVTALTDKNIPLDQRRKLAEAFHLDPRIASQTTEEVRKALTEGQKEAAQFAPSLEQYKGLDEAADQSQARCAGFLGYGRQEWRCKSRAQRYRCRRC
jgi:DNA-binding transcriptional MerR regulator